MKGRQPGPAPSSPRPQTAARRWRHSGLEPALVKAPRGAAPPVGLAAVAFGPPRRGVSTWRPRCGCWPGRHGGRVAAPRLLSVSTTSRWLRQRTCIVPAPRPGVRDQVSLAGSRGGRARGPVQRHSVACRPVLRGSAPQPRTGPPVTPRRSTTAGQTPPADSVMPRGTLGAGTPAHVWGDTVPPVTSRRGDPAHPPSHSCPVSVS